MKSKNKKDKKAILSAVGVGAAFCAFSFLTFTIVSPIVSSNAATANASVGPTMYKASMSNENKTKITVVPTSDQTVFTGTNTITYTNTCPKGFNITLSSASSDTNLTRSGSDTAPKTIPTIASGTALTDNTWGYSIDNGSAYNPIPAVNTPVNILNTSSATTNPATLDVVYGIKTNDRMPSGSYVNDVMYTITVKPECLNYTLKWDLDGGTAESGKTYADESVRFGSTKDMSSYRPTKKGFTLTGWKSSIDNTVFDATDSSYVNINPTNVFSMTLTAQWRRNPLGEIDDMQELTPAICAAASVDDKGLLRDSRDGKTYEVQKLKDGHCWMAQNLRLDNYTLTSADSDVYDSFTVPATITTLSEENFNGGYQIDPNDVYIRSDTGYYSYYVATAGTGPYRFNEAQVPASVCPKGWRLPSKAEYENLADLYVVSTSWGPWYKFPIGFAIVGVAIEGEIKGEWSYGLYWTADSRDGNAWAFEYMSGGDNAFVGATSKVQGAQVRCIDENRTLSDITKMQSINPAIVANTAENASATLTDMRDNKTYTVKKLKDGNIWMTENLKLINKQVWAAESNYPTPGGDTDAFTIPASSTVGFDTYNTKYAYLDSTYGGYYSIYTATAGWGTDSVTSGDSPRDICPKGWKMPTANDFTTLTGLYNTSAALRGDPGLVYSGAVHHSALSSVGQAGGYWSSTTYSGTQNRGLYIDNSGFEIGTSANYEKYVGRAVRCLTH